MRRRRKKPFWKVHQKQATWKPELPVAPGKEEKGNVIGGKTTISRAGVRRVESDSGKKKADEMIQARRVQMKGCQLWTKFC